MKRHHIAEQWLCFQVYVIRGVIWGVFYAVKYGVFAVEYGVFSAV